MRSDSSLMNAPIRRCTAICAAKMHRTTAELHIRQAATPMLRTLRPNSHGKQLEDSQIVEKYDGSVRWAPGIPGTTAELAPLAARMAKEN